MRYELIREIYNQCSNNQMRDVFVSEVDTSDPALVMSHYCNSSEDVLEREDLGNGVVCFHLVSHGLRQRFTFTPDD
ncbi:MAG: hypothetical protein J6K89_08950 [Oscillospiraceae bacterium]|nr:hypothetical protein [Oscillospiraceae bacterium]